MPENVYLLTVKEPYATALVCGVVTAYIHKLNLAGKTCLIHVGNEVDLSSKDTATYFRKIGDASLTEEFYTALTLSGKEGSEAISEVLSKAETAPESEDRDLARLLLSNLEPHVLAPTGNIIGIVHFDDSEPIASRHKNFVDTFQLFPEKDWKSSKGHVNLVEWNLPKFW